VKEMEIKIIGKNSSNRIKMMKNLEKSMKEIDEKINIEICEDDKDIQKFNISNTPALMINGKVVSQGKILTDKEIKKYIKLLS